MTSRDTILKNVKAAQPSISPLPQLPQHGNSDNNADQFKTVLESIGGRVISLPAEATIAHTVLSLFPDAKRIVSSITSLEQYFFTEHKTLLQHSLQDVDIAIIEAQFCVAENGAIWVTEEDLKIRVLPFICEHLVAVVNARDIVSNMHEAYARIASSDYGFGVFIAGPSKTADIEQSLVLGAHGPKSMTVLLLAVR